MRQFLTIRQFSEKNPAFSEPSLRWQIFNSATNGLAASGAILRNGRRILIDPEKFVAWIEAKQPKTPAARHGERSEAAQYEVGPGERSETRKSRRA